MGPGGRRGDLRLASAGRRDASEGAQPTRIRQSRQVVDWTPHRLGLDRRERSDHVAAPRAQRPSHGDPWWRPHWPGDKSEYASGTTRPSHPGSPNVAMSRRPSEARPQAQWRRCESSSRVTIYPALSSCRTVQRQLNGPPCTEPSDRPPDSSDGARHRTLAIGRARRRDRDADRSRPASRACRRSVPTFGSARQRHRSE